MEITGPDDDGVSRVAQGFKIIPYDIPRGCVAGYFPELNVLVPLSSYGEGAAPRPRNRSRCGSA
nr:hypothetical protein [Marinicella sp. W31]MDC2876609.1 hypothetical protein [Marinicella sp. W31]